MATEKEIVMAACLELSHAFAGTRPEWQHEANAVFFFRIWKSLAVDGMYAWPSASRVFKKTPTGWEQVTLHD